MCFYYILLDLKFSSNMHFIFIGEFGLVTFTDVLFSSLTFFFIVDTFLSHSQYLCHNLSHLFKENGPKSVIDSDCPDSPVQPCSVSSHYWNSLSDAEHWALWHLPKKPYIYFKFSHHTVLLLHYMSSIAVIRLPYICNRTTSLHNETHSFIEYSEPTNSHGRIL